MMYSESHFRSVAKAISWRMLGTITTSVLVFIFTRRLALSVAVGVLEFTSKIGLFWLHERVWDRIRLGRRRTRPAVLWFTGLSGSGKSTISAKVATELHSRGFEVEHLDGDTIRIEHLPEEIVTGASPGATEITTLEEIIRVVFHNESEELAPRSVDEVMALCEGRTPPEPSKRSLPTPERAPMDHAPTAVFESQVGTSPLEGETYRIRFDVNMIESETERIADFFKTYQRIKEMLGEQVSPDMLGDFVDFIVDTARRLKTAEGADFAEFSLHVRDQRDRLFVETVVSHSQRSRESALRQVGYLK